MQTTSPFRCENGGLKPHACACALLCTPVLRFARGGLRHCRSKFEHVRMLPQSENLAAVEERLRKLGVPFIKTQVEEGGVRVTQVRRTLSSAHVVYECTVRC